METIALRSRRDELSSILQQDVVDISQLRSCCFHGIPDEMGLRPLCWKLLLNYIPEKKSKWPTALLRQRNLYHDWTQEFIIRPGKQDAPDDVLDSSSRHDITCDDHPLNPSPQSTWSTYFKDNEVLVQIDKDARRLYPDMCFFQRSTEFPLRTADHNDGAGTVAAEYLRRRIDQCVLKSSAIVKNRSGGWNISGGVPRRATQYQNLSESEEAHWEVVERMLFLYAKLNPGQSYVQGMNEIIGPLYFTFSTDKDKTYREHAEADTFFCFTNLMAEIRDRFIKHLDDSTSGIVSSMSQLMLMLKEADEVLSKRLEELDIKPQYYSFRWLTLMLSQEFALPEVLHLWDALFCDVRRFDFLLDICVAMLILIRDQLLDGDFAAAMKLLQNYPISDVDQILGKAVHLRRGMLDKQQQLPEHSLQLTP